MEKSSSKHLYDRVALLILNNKALLEGLVDEETKINIDRQIELAFK